MNPWTLVIAWLVWWLGLYLLAREPRQRHLVWGGVGLASFAVAMALDSLAAEPFISGWRVIALGGSLLAAGAALWHRRWPAAKRPLRAVFTLAFLLLLLGLGLLLPGDHTAAPWRDWLLRGMAVELLLIGGALAWRDAFEQGEALLPDMLRSLDYSFFLALLFGGQVALVMVLVGEPTFGLEVLLLAIVATATVVQVFAAPVARLVERFAFFNSPTLQAERATLRAASDAAARRADPHPLLADEGRFLHLTRRALSHYGDLSRLVASPLINLPLIERRLAARGLPDNPLGRAHELKALLAESIARLKPASGQFGVSDEWRHYNALYFPYVVGLKPYSQRLLTDGLAPDEQSALAWFQSQVPQRTLYNWQATAAALVAQDLRAQHEENSIATD